MLKINKYKLFKITHFFFSKFPWRILRFRREKWFELKQRLIKIKLRRNQFARFKSLLKRKVKIKRWTKLKTLYKRELTSKRLFYIIFNNAIRIKFFQQQRKKNFNYAELKTGTLVKPYFRQDVLLWSLNFFNSTAESRRFAKMGSIILNNKKLKISKFLIKGDILEINKYFFNLKTLRKKYSKTKRFITFIETDYYTNTLIVVKHFTSLGSYDFPLITQEVSLTKSLKHVF